MTSLLDQLSPSDGVLHRVPVLLPVALDQTYEYVISEARSPQAGQFVLVPANRVTPLTADSSDVMAMIVSGGVSGAETGTGHGARGTG